MSKDVTQLLVRSGLFSTTCDWDANDFAGWSNAERVFAACGMLGEVTNEYIVSSWVNPYNLQAEFRSALYGIVRHGTVAPPSGGCRIPVQHSVRDAALLWIKSNYKQFDPITLMSANALKIGCPIHSDLRSGIFDAIPQPYRALLWLLTLPVDPDETIAQAKKDIDR